MSLNFLKLVRGLSFVSVKEEMYIFFSFSFEHLIFHIF